MWPKLSIVTPSYNQGMFIEQTIQSVLSQSYPNLEYIIIDGVSTDHSLEIIKKYSSRLAYWVSEKDGGQSHAINKGWERTTGDWLTFLNSDDYLEPEALFKVARAIQTWPEYGFFYGGCNIVDQDGKFIRKYRVWDYSFKELIHSRSSLIPQQGTFIKRESLFHAGLLDTSFQMAMDYDLWLRLGQITQGKRLDDTLANWRYYPDSKTQKFPLLRQEEHLRSLKKLEKTWHIPASELHEKVRSRIVSVLKGLVLSSWNQKHYWLAAIYAVQLLRFEPRSVKKLMSFLPRVAAK